MGRPRHAAAIRGNGCQNVEQQKARHDEAWRQDHWPIEHGLGCGELREDTHGARQPGLYGKPTGNEDDQDADDVSQHKRVCGNLTAPHFEKEPQGGETKGKVVNADGQFDL